MTRFHFIAMDKRSDSICILQLSAVLRLADSCFQYIMTNIITSTSLFMDSTNRQAHRACQVSINYSHGSVVVRPLGCLAFVKPLLEKKKGADFFADTFSESFECDCCGRTTSVNLIGGWERTFVLILSFSRMKKCKLNYDDFGNNGHSKSLGIHMIKLAVKKIIRVIRKQANCLKEALQNWPGTQLNKRHVVTMEIHTSCLNKTKEVTAFR